MTMNEIMSNTGFIHRTSFRENYFFLLWEMEQLSQWIPNSLIIQSKNIALRHWERHNLTISLAIYDDRIEIASPGIFPPQITPENIKEPHESYPHNLKVAEALYRMTYLENWGSGAKRILDACKAQGVDAPTWASDGGFVTVTFKRPYLKTNTLKTDREDNRTSKPDNYRSTTDQVPFKFKK